MNEPGIPKLDNETPFLVNDEHRNITPGLHFSFFANEAVHVPAWHERDGEITNESLRGMKSRADLLVSTNEKIGALNGIGSPLKLLLQAVLLEPQHSLTLIDISAQTTCDALVLFSALKQGFTNTSEFAENNPEAVKEILKVFSDLGFATTTIKDKHTSDVVNAGFDHLSELDINFDALLTSLSHLNLNVSKEQILDLIKKIPQIEVVLGSINDTQLLSEIPTETKSGRVVIDISNVPILKENRSILRDSIILFASERDTTLRSKLLGNLERSTDKPVSLSRIRRYPRSSAVFLPAATDWDGWMVVGIAPNPNSYFDQVAQYSLSTWRN
jgi:hypothetical protein